MCTVSWVRDDEGYQLLCNRDEKRTRAGAVGPGLIERDGVRMIAPVDGQHGGSWLSVNEFGVTLCMLNGANLGGCGVSPTTPGTRSRGLLLLDLASGEAVLDVCQRAWEMDLERYSPFTLAILEPGRATALFEWSGSERMVLLNGEPYMPLVSSSYDPEGVRRHRRDEFARHTSRTHSPDAAQLFSFHESHGPGADAYSPCMHREDAQTVSFSWVKVAGRRAEFFYSPAAPCQWRPGQTQALELAH